MLELGNRVEDSTIDFKWSSNSSAGASITRSTNGTISVYKGSGTTQSTAGITDTEDFDALTGIHHVTIDTAADAFYAVDNDYDVVLSAATIDGQTVNAVLAHFRIERGFAEVDVTKWLGTAAATPTVAGVPEVDLTHIAGSAVSTSTAQLGVNAVQAGGTAWGSGAITAASIASDAITDAKVASDVTIASVTGAVGSVTGNVGGNVTGTIGGLTAAAIKDFFDTDSTTTYASAVAGSVVKEIADNASGSGGPTAAAIADAVWDEDATAHQTQGSFGQVVGDSVSDSDSIWALVNTNLNATVGSRASQTTADAIEVDTQDIQSRLPAALVSGRMASDAVAISGSTVAADAVETNIGNLDATVSSRLATAGYTAPLDAAGTRTAVGLASANLDTQLDAIPTAAEINAEVVDCLATDTYAELGSVPAATSSLAAKLRWLFMLARNVITQTATTQTLRNDADSGDVATSTHSDNGTTHSRGEWT